MKYGKVLALLIPLLAVPACDDSGVTGPQSRGAEAKVRFVNVNVDTGTVDLRFVDKVENLPTLLGVGFRAHSGVYQPTAAGTRPVRVFPNATNPALTSTVLVETNLNLVTDARYTFVYAGRVKSGNATLHVFEDPIQLPDPPAGSIAVKAMHAAFGTGAVDVYVVPVATTAAATPADFTTSAVTVIRNVGYLTQTAYVNVPVRPSAGLPFYRIVVTAAGSVTPLFAATPNLPGADPPAGATYGPQPGVRISGSVLTILVAPGSDVGTRESAAANQSPTALFLIDKALNPAPAS